MEIVADGPEVTVLWCEEHTRCAQRHPFCSHRHREPGRALQPSGKAGVEPASDVLHQTTTTAMLALMTAFELMARRSSSTRFEQQC